MRVTKGKLRMTTFKEIHGELTVIFSYLIGSYREKVTLLGDAQRTKGNGHKLQHGK